MAARLHTLGFLASLLHAALSAEEVPVVPLELLPLRTSGRWILDNKGQRFRLRCANWYGASGELHVVHGLHMRTLRELVAELRALSFNCVRLPFSLELFFDNPPVPAHALAADPLKARANLTGLEAYDAAVEAITAAGLLVLVDNHSSDSGWCCKAGAPDGVWFTAKHSEEHWIEALVAMARRYRGNPRVVGADIRNEVRDTASIQTVWGESFLGVQKGKAVADWPAAAERAGNAILAENSELLVLVTGLCFGQDLRGARSRPIELSVPGRLVWTVHSYHWYFWFHNTQAKEASGRPVVAACATTAAVSGLYGTAAYCRGLRASWQASVEVFLAFVTVVGLLLLLVAALIENPSCADLRQRERYPWCVSGIVALAAALLGVLLCWLRSRARRALRRQGKEHRRRCERFKANVLPSLCCLMLASSALAVLLFPNTDWQISAQLTRHWGFVLEEGHPYTAPVVLGEFGTKARSAFWLGLTGYVAEQELGFAYWPFNGQRWLHDEDRWRDAPFGILDESWQRVRHDWKLSDLANVQKLHV